MTHLRPSGFAGRGPGRGLSDRVAALIVVLAATVPYLPTLGNYFAQDDFGVVWLLSQKAWSTFPRWFFTTWMDNIWGYTPDEIRPFPAVSYQIAALFGAGVPAPNHVINLALHALNALLVFRIARTAAAVSSGAATLAAVIFAVLPIQAESVAWITGRVDSLPAAAYFASFALYVAWRQGGGPAAYWWSVVLCFVGLFTKQNVITLGPALVLYDWCLPAEASLAPTLPAGRRSVSEGGPGSQSEADKTRPTQRAVPTFWRWARPYLPFALLTTGYLLLRYVLFGQLAREETLTAQRLHDFATDSGLHLRRLLFGDTGMKTMGAGAAMATIAALVAVWVAARRAGSTDVGRSARAASYFALGWTALGMAPILVSGYYSPRHMYLASLGWAVTIGVAFQLLWNLRPTRAWLALVAGGAIALVTAYAVQLVAVVREWEVRSAVSQRAVLDLEREAVAAPEGALIIAGAPRQSWAFALPYAVRPPFTNADVGVRAFVISDSSLHCCAAGLWEAYTRTAIREWMAQPEPRPVIALFWNPETGALSRVTDREEPYLRALMSVLLETPDRAALDGAIARLLSDLVAPHRR